MKTLMQILPSLENSGGGVERGTLDIAKEAAEKGYNSMIVSAGGNMSEKYKHKGVVHLKLPLKKKNLFTFLKSRHLFKKILKKFSPDIIHVRSRWPAFCLNKLIKKNNIPLVTTYHGTYSGNQFYFKKKYNEFMTNGEKVIAISEFIKDHVNNNFPKCKKKVFLINRGIDTNFFNMKKVTQYRKESFLKNFSIDESKHIILLPGRLSSWKGHNLAIETARIISQDYPDLNFLMLFVGSEQTRKKYLESIRRKIKKYKLEQKIILTGQVSDMPAVYSLSDVVISTSTEPEAFGRVSAEASAMTKPIISSNHGGSCNIIINNVTGWLVNVDDPLALAKKIVSVIEMPQSEKDHIGEKARERITSYFGLKQMLNKTLDLYEEIISEEKKNSDN